MSRSDSEIMAGGRVPHAATTAARTGAPTEQSQEDPSPADPTQTDPPPYRAAWSLGEPPYRAISDQELTLVQICCDFLCACVTLPVALIVLANLSTVPSNAPASS